MSDMVLHGGQFEQQYTLDFLQLWDFTVMPIFMVDTIAKGMQLTSLDQLEPNMQFMRLHAFGEGGDLQLRNDAGMVYWRFVGQAQHAPLPDQSGARDYGKHLERGRALESLLWGKFDEELGEYHEDRVGKAKLSYPVQGSGQRVMLHAHEIVNEASEVMAVWTHKLQTVEDTASGGQE